MPHLDVYLNRIWAGQLHQDEGGRLGFSYREAFLHSPEAAPLSRHLPLRPQVFGDEATSLAPPFSCQGFGLKNGASPELASLFFDCGDR